MARAPFQLRNTASDRAAQLLQRVLREGLAGVGLDDLLVQLAQILQRLGGQLGVALHARRLLRLFEWMFEVLAVDAEHDPSVHRDEPAVAVVREPLVRRDSGETLHALIVEAEVEDRVHHARHRELGSRPHADQQRIAGVAQLATHRLFELGDVSGDLGIEPRRPTTLHVRPARIGGDRESGRDRQLQHAGHLGQIRPLAAEEILVLHGRATVFVIESEDVGHENRVYAVPIGGRQFPSA
jgi:hypothetical protein